MPSFDIIDSASAGYMLVWKERGYILGLAAAPFVIKMLCYTLVLMLGWEQDFTRQAVVMLPSYFADGWMLSHLTRLVFFEQRWPFRPTGNAEKDLPVLQERALGIMRGTLTYAVIQYLMTGVKELIYMGPAGAEEAAQEPTLAAFAMALAFMVAAIWAFRLMWLYIPAAVNYPLSRFLRDLGGYAASWPLLGIWLFCFIPPFFVFGITLSMLNAMVQGSGAPASGEIIFLVNFLRELLYTLVGIIATAGMATAIKKYLMPRDKRK